MTKVNKSLVKSFKHFFFEAKISDENFARVLSVFEKRLPKYLGKLYRFGGADYVQTLGSIKRIIYIFKDRAFAVRYTSDRVLGFDVWTKFNISSFPTHYVDVSALKSENLIGAIAKLGKIIANPSIGDYEVTPEELEKTIQEAHLYEMARRVSDNDFYKMAVQAYGHSGAEAVTWDQIKAIAQDNDVLIPGYVRDQKIGRGKWTLKPGAVDDVVPSSETSSEPKTSTSREVSADVVTPIRKKDAPTLFIKVTAQDPVTKKFIAAGESREAQDLYKQIQTSLSSHVPSEKELRDPKTLYGHMAQLVAMACKGTLRSLLIYGGPGTGKTFTIMQTIKEEGLVAGKDYVKISGKASPISIYQTMFMFREGGLILFDDCDSMWGNEDATNILKAALDTSPVREISWNGRNTINVSKMSDEKRQALYRQIDKQIAADSGDEEAEVDLDDGSDEEDKPAKTKKGGPVRFPSAFDFTGRVVFISNLKKDQFDSAIMSRSAKICMDLTPEEILMRMRDVLPTLGGDDVEIEKKEELLEHLIKMNKDGELTEVTMREFVKGMLVLRSGAPNWRDLCQYM